MDKYRNRKKFLKFTIYWHQIWFSLSVVTAKKGYFLSFLVFFFLLKLRDAQPIYLPIKNQSKYPQMAFQLKIINKRNHNKNYTLYWILSPNWNTVTRYLKMRFIFIDSIKIFSIVLSAFQVQRKNVLLLALVLCP